MGKPWNRRARYRFCLVAVLLVLVVASFIRVLRHAAREAASNSTGRGSDGLPSALRLSSGGYDANCLWAEGDPQLYMLKHHAMDSSGQHWFHIAESYTGRRTTLKELIAGISGNSTIYMHVGRLYSKIEDSKWMADMSSMGRLLILSALTSAGTSTVHFVDADRASFLYQSQGEESTTVGGGQEGGHAFTVPNPEVVLKDGQPPAGQIGLLKFHAAGEGQEFVVDVVQSLPERLSVTAHPSGDNGSSSPSDSLGGGSGGVRGGEEAKRSVSVASPAPVCVKFLRTVGRNGLKRKDWFPTQDDALSLLRVVDAYCPVSWLRDGSYRSGSREGGGRGRRLDRGSRERRGSATATDGNEDKEVTVGVVGDRRRHLLLYQRDRNRKIVHSEQVLDRLREKLGPGWIVEKMTHDPSRHPCELVDRLSTTDVLLTAHGFQSMLALFMPPGSLIFEIFPHKYFKLGYAPMAEGLGVRHAYSQSAPRLPLTGFSWPSTEACMKRYLCRWYVRLANVELDEGSLELVARLALEE